MIGFGRSWTGGVGACVHKDKAPKVTCFGRLHPAEENGRRTLWCGLLSPKGAVEHLVVFSMKDLESFAIAWRRDSTLQSWSSLRFGEVRDSRIRILGVAFQLRQAATSGYQFFCVANHYIVDRYGSSLNTCIA